MQLPLCDAPQGPTTVDRSAAPKAMAMQ